ncbi:MAG: YqaA family protein [Pseudomonadota bacterium]|nr:YqaA family protein [Pseudomonadota bacterium]
MKLFTGLYEWTVRAAGHRHAPWYLGGVSFAESSFFPVPPDVMLIPMALAKPNRALQFALLTTIASVAGGLLGYILGHFAFDALAPWIERMGYTEKLELVQELFRTWGVWVVFIAGFSPIPYKMFTIASGFMGMALLPFIVASFIGRGARFFLVSFIVGRWGAAVEGYIKDYMEFIGWGVATVLVAMYFVL